MFNNFLQKTDQQFPKDVVTNLFYKTLFSLTLCALLSIRCQNWGRTIYQKMKMRRSLNEGIFGVIFLKNTFFFVVGQPHESNPTEDRTGDLTILLSRHFTRTNIKAKIMYFFSSASVVAFVKPVITCASGAKLSMHATLVLLADSSFTRVSYSLQTSLFLGLWLMPQIFPHFYHRSDNYILLPINVGWGK